MTTEIKTPTQHFNGNATELFDVLPAIKGVTTRVCGGFSSPEAFVAWLNSDEASNPWTREGRRDGEAEFSGTKTYAEATELALNGWQEGARKAERLRDLINANNPVGPRITKYDVAGSIVHVGRYLSGNPLHMKRVDTAKLRRKPVITIASHFGALAGVDKDNMLRRAAVVAAVVDAIEAAGYSCHVIGYCVSTAAQGSGETAVTVKEAGQHVDLARMAFGLGHPSMFRRLVFAWRGGTKVLQRAFNNSIGGTKSQGLTMPEGSQAYMIPSIELLGEHNFQSDDVAAKSGLDVIIRALASQGCPAFAGRE